MRISGFSLRALLRILFTILLLAHSFEVLSQNRNANPQRRDTSVAGTNLSKEEWVSIGPIGIPLTNNDVVMGQVNAIAVDPRAANTVYIGASEGGVWKTSDGGGTWSPLTDLKLVRDIVVSPNVVRSKGTLAIGAIAIDPVRPDTVYVGTGNPNMSTFTAISLGAFRTTDGGENWVPMGASPLKDSCQNALMSQALVNRIIVRSGDPTVVYAATNMGLFYYKEDGNDCWQQSSEGLAAGNVIDLAVDNLRGVFYAAVWGVGIFRSSDPIAQPWTKLTNGLPTNELARIALAFGGRTIFGDPAPIVYASFGGTTRYQLFKTEDGGNSWTELPSPPNENWDRLQTFNSALAVGLFSSEDVYYGQVSVWRALDSGSKGGVNDFKPTPPVTDNSWYNLSCCLSFSHVNPLRRGMDLHSDIHDIVFAPVGSYTITPEMIQIVYVANDGGVSRGFVDSKGTITWQQMTQGLAIGQVGTIALDPKDSSITVAGLWHNGNVRTVAGQYQPLPFGGGDGFETGIDAGIDPTGKSAIYHNKNAGYDGKISRTKFDPATGKTTQEMIWANGDGFRYWSDPYRSGHLFFLGWSGKLFRTTNALTGTAAQLNSPNAWELIEPPGKTGNTYTMAFKNALLENQPVYYLGTSTGELWRGTPGEAWTKICGCDKQINGIGPDLMKNERVFVVLNMTSGPGRIKEFTLKPNGTWAGRDIDETFLPQLQVTNLTTVVVDPMVPDTDGTTIYVGSEQGIYRGDLRKPAVGGNATVNPSTVLEWTWTRSPGVPNVLVTDLEVHQSRRNENRNENKIVIIRAGTYGRGIFELNRTAGKKIPDWPRMLEVTATEIAADGAPPSVAAQIAVISSGSRSTRDVPFKVSADDVEEISLEAPTQIQSGNRVLKFVGWVVSGKRHEVGNKISIKVAEASTAVAFYKGEETQERAEGPPSVSLSADAEFLCAQGLTHRLNITWRASGGQPTLGLTTEIVYPDGHVETGAIRSRNGSQQYLLTAPKGGSVRIKITAQDANKATASATTAVQLKPCR